MKTLRIILLSLSLAIACLIYILPFAVTFYLNSLFKDQSVRIERINSIFPGSSDLAVNQVDVSLPINESGLFFKINAESVLIPYDLLLLKNRLSEIIDFHNLSIGVQGEDLDIKFEPNLSLSVSRTDDIYEIDGTLEGIDEQSTAGLIKHFDPTKAQFEIGAVKANFLIHLKDGVLLPEKSNINASIKAPILQIENLKFRRLALDLKMFPVNNTASGKLKLDIRSLTYFTTLENIKYSSSINASSKETYLSDISSQANFLGGVVKISGKKLIVHPRREGEISASLSNVDLKNILSLYPSETVKGEGLVDIILPLQFTKDGPNLKNGIIQSKDKGILRVDIGEQQPGSHMELVSKALKNFHYNSLYADVNLEPNGKLMFALQIKGANPDLNNGQPINVNANVEQNLWALLDSIRYVQKVM